MHGAVFVQTGALLFVPELGLQKDVIIFSCVRSGKEVGFLREPKRLNVALTRARCGNFDSIMTHHLPISPSLSGSTVCYHPHARRAICFTPEYLVPPVVLDAGWRVQSDALSGSIPLFFFFPRHGLFIIGKVNTLKRDPLWKALVRHLCLLHCRLTWPALFPPRSLFRYPI